MAMVPIMTMTPIRMTHHGHSLALVLLGLGWNFGIISGTALVVDVTALDQGARIQGAMDIAIAIAIAGAGGVALSGWVVATSSYATLAFGRGLLALLLVPWSPGPRLPRVTSPRGSGPGGPPAPAHRDVRPCKPGPARIDP
jgi:hypothetical protein